MIEYDDGEFKRDVGQVNIQNLYTPCPEISYFIGETPLWGKGIATRAIVLAIDWLRKHGYKRVCADTLLSNPASMRVLEKLGFIETEGRDGLKSYVLEL